YPILSIPEDKLAKAVIKNIDASVRDLYNVCKAIRGMNLKEAREFLNNVLEEKEALPFWRYSHGTSHRSNISRKWKVKSGRYPKKAIKYVLKLLDNAENNANSKGLDIDNLKIVHIAAHKGLVLKRYMTRAFGRSTRKYKYLSHIEVILGE
nr:Chain L22P, 50S ribosomal protein L22 [Sulfolobus acidocaldarius DSM 639]8HKV_L22P Chain L22P, 50S ribosomal protein L22 [Sulfolobus acidocaldarius DSM 639]8HKY_L22P Chain L22P, 50S ribosomal protein L22 [Sulfolobus acidocaldarius DSM 639]8HKZ_L22P Chain L22P, 50S ribosomal protein L22 [Sulfolobus acidocaldarius DSM 639]8HL1_L22P Chain L22P, 50S ribosomal protein L22 [Sulfolobus acidocaldarius DSM 639]8HL2_L22P Chain L22P, 50S ribosomal protein L22 [Sulfolobus acidocaldarius DSM 639]8HL3_L